MIGRLQGILLSKGEAEVLLDVQGVGYEVEVSASTLYQLPDPGKPLELYTHFVVREDAQHLYGFLLLAERSLFRLLLKVNGVGPRLALGIMSGMDSSRFVAAVAKDDVNALVKIPGVGRKTAERLIIELRDKLKQWELEHGTAPQGVATVRKPAQQDNFQEAEAALISLGYKPQEASRAVMHAVTQLENGEQPPATEQLIRVALKSLGRAAAG
jgi:holliday junction DNA helicase RuvA